MIRLYLTIAFLIVSLPVYAQQLSQYTAVRVQEANELAQSERLVQAIDRLNAIETSKPYEQAFVARMLGVFYWQNGQMAPAMSQLELAVSSGLLQDENAWITKRMLADLYLSELRYNKALSHYYPLLKSIPEGQNGDDIWFRIAQAHYQQQQWTKVIPAADAYLELRPVELKPSLSLKLGAQLQLKLWKEATVTLKQLIELEPMNVEWWRQLTGLYMQLNQTRSALDVLALAKAQQVDLSQQDRRLLAQLYSKRGIPERAAIEISQLDAANSSEKLLVEQASYWQMAKEWDKAIDIWQLAAQFNAKYYWNASQLILQQGDYQLALQTLDKVPGNKEQVALAKTRAYYKLGQFEKALIQAKAANRVKASKQASSWMDYLSKLRTQS